MVPFLQTRQKNHLELCREVKPQLITNCNLKMSWSPSESNKDTAGVEGIILFPIHLLQAFMILSKHNPSGTHVPCHVAVSSHAKFPLSEMDSYSAPASRARALCTWHSSPSERAKGTSSAGTIATRCYQVPLGPGCALFILLPPLHSIFRATVCIPGDRFMSVSPKLPRDTLT